MIGERPLGFGRRNGFGGSVRIEVVDPDDGGFRRGVGGFGRGADIGHVFAPAHIDWTLSGCITYDSKMTAPGGR